MSHDNVQEVAIFVDVQSVDPVLIYIHHVQITCAVVHARGGGGVHHHHHPHHHQPHDGAV
jgi:hypothetical protein